MTVTLAIVRAELETAAWAAFDARKAHGEESAPYLRALAVLNKARQAFEAVSELEARL